MQVDHVRNDFVHIPFSTSVQEGGSFSVAEGVNFGSPALSMKSADFRPGTTENSLEKEDRCAGWRPRIIESAGEPFGLSRTFDEDSLSPAQKDRESPGKRGSPREVVALDHRECGRTQFWCRLTATA